MVHLVKLHSFIRSLIISPKLIEKYIPQSGHILDIGCGYGVISHHLATTSSKRHILGIDPSLIKINRARATYQRPNLSFKVAYAQNQIGKFQAIVIVNVLYLLPPKEKARLIYQARRLLAPDGKLILVVFNNQKSKLIAALVAFEEKVAVHLLHQTFTKYPKLYFTSPAECSQILLTQKMKIIHQVETRGLIPYHQTVFIAKKDKSVIHH